uniref:Succinate dehydrogenase cytochrome b560 subunit, mitochondrial n=1 Tax=Plectus sambesii TaxID=2011161 RepID=A0A914UT73_9BILA
MLRSFCAAGGRSGSILSKLDKNTIVQVMRIQTSAPLASYGAHTPIQKWGGDYLERQKALKRPLSPHLGIYQPQLTWYVSGAHRILGCIMAGTLIIGSVGFMVLPLDFTAFIEFVRSLGLPGVVTSAFKFIIAFPMVFHFLNGIRFLGYDMGKGITLNTIYKTGWAVVWVSVLISLIVTFMPQK